MEILQKNIRKTKKCLRSEEICGRIINAEKTSELKLKNVFGKKLETYR